MSPPGRAGTIFTIVLAFVRGPFAVAGLILVAFGLGYWGFRSIEGAQLSVADSLYSSLQLFNTDAQLPSAAATPWQLEVARFLAPLSIAYAALAAVFALLRDQLQRLRARLFARNHVVLVGLGDRGTRLARSLRRKHRLVAIESDAANGSIRALRTQGIPVLMGDGRDPELLRSARIDRAAHAVVLTSDDSLNLEVVASLAGAVDTNRPALQHVAIDGASLWAELHRLPLHPETARRRVEFFSLPDRTAEAIVRSTENLPDGASARRVYIRGEGAVAARLIVHLLRSARFDAMEAVVLGADEHTAVMEDLNSADPWVRERCDITAGSLHDASATVAFVCGLHEAEALTSAAAISRQIPHAPVFVAVQDRDTERALAGSGLALDRVTLVPAEDLVLSESLLRRSAIELIALGKHLDYMAQQTAHGETAAENPSIAPWEELPESLRESNRRFAEGVADALAELGAELGPLTGPTGDGRLDLASERLDQLARGEHERWVRDQRRDGWEWTAGPKDPEKRQHPMLVEWEELSEAEREKDRDGIRALPALLARVGYELRMPT